MTDERRIAVITDYEGMLTAFRDLAAERGLALSGDSANAVAGLPNKYIQKLIGANPVRRIGMISLGALLGVLGAKLIMVEDEETLKRYGDKVEKRNELKVSSSSFRYSVTRRFMQKIGRAGGTNRMNGLTPWQRKQLARKAARIRWDNAEK
jgi:hypothetical protein